MEHRVRVQARLMCVAATAEAPWSRLDVITSDELAVALEGDALGDRLEVGPEAVSGAGTSGVASTRAVAAGLRAASSPGSTPCVDGLAACPGNPP